MTTSNNVPSKNQIDEIVNNVELSKSEKIRRLYALGSLSQYRISKLMGVIPQFVNNVITKDKTKVAKEATK